MDLPQRPRRNRKSEPIRRLVRETQLSPSDLIYPVFVQEGTKHDPIDSLPGLTRWGVADPAPFVEHLEHARALGVPAVALFPKIDPSLKSLEAVECANPDGLVPRAIHLIKDSVPGLTVITDVALDPYSSIGHDGVASGGDIDNDRTVKILCDQALAQAAAGADVIAPSDMMDGRVGAIRQALDQKSFTNVSILSYTAKYASAYYGPFRGALDSAPVDAPDVPPDKKTYQMDPANAREALREGRLDEAEGADMLMVKPAGPYLDVIRLLREHTALPIAAYQVSGEYLMLHAAAQSGWLELQPAALEALTAIKRAGADMILTYLAPQAAEWLA